MQTYDAFDLKYTSREVTAWGGLALLKRMVDGMGLREAIQGWGLPALGSNRSYAPSQLIEQMIVSIWGVVLRAFAMPTSPALGLRG